MGARLVVVSPDGKSLYVAASGVLSTFSRDTETGLLEFVSKLENTLGIDSEGNLTISADGRFVYSAAPNHDAVAVFERDVETGTLSHVETLRSEFQEEVTPGLKGAFGVTISPDDAYLYVASTEDSTVTVFLRDTESGRLTFIESPDNGGPNDPDQIDDPYDLAVSPDGSQVYVAYSTENVIQSFKKETERPLVTINQLAPQVDPTNTLPINFEVEFSEPVLGFDGDDVNFGSIDGIPSVTIDQTGTNTFSISIESLEADGPVTPTIISDSVTDFAGNGNLESTSEDNLVNFDTTPPEIQITNPEYNTVEVGGSYSEPGALAIDTLDGIVNVVISGDTSAPAGEVFEIHYDAVDSAGNAAVTAIRAVSRHRGRYYSSDHRSE
jgi:6-phosphogluconolactonase (cycloisomerase 2 family)